MQIEIDLFRDFLLKVEETPATTSTITFVAGFNGNAKNLTISKHLELLAEEGLLKLEVGYHTCGQTIYHAKNHITTRGREFLDNIRSEEQWNLIKDIAAKSDINSLRKLMDIAEGVNPISEMPGKGSKIFIVHGHDDLAKIETARFINKVGLEEVILHEQASQGNTIIEKIEEYSDVGFAIVLYTACDLGSTVSDPENKNLRARQNVVFEHGYFVAKLDRKNVCALVKGNVEKPSDISGVVYIEMDELGAWKYSLAKEMKASGYEIDLNKL